LKGKEQDIIDTYLEKNGKIKLPNKYPLGQYVLFKYMVDYEGKAACFKVQVSKFKEKNNHSTKYLNNNNCYYRYLNNTNNKIGKRKRNKKKSRKKKRS